MGEERQKRGESQAKMPIQAKPTGVTEGFLETTENYPECQLKLGHGEDGRRSE